MTISILTSSIILGISAIVVVSNAQPTVIQVMAHRFLITAQ